MSTLEKTLGFTSPQEPPANNTFLPDVAGATPHRMMESDPMELVKLSRSTAITTVSFAVAPALSATVNSNSYTPPTRFVNLVCAISGLTMVDEKGPDTLLHLYLVMLPS